MSELQFDVVDAQGPKQFFSGLTPAGLAHAYLFAGPPGVGKKTFARRLAQSLLCQAPKSGVLGYDGTCSSCTLFAAGERTRHPDFFEHDGVLKIGDRDGPAGFADGEDLTARDVVRQLSMQSYGGGMRVLLLADVDFATHHAANALLKFLEEPPRGVVMILTTPAPGRLLTTIRSRLVEVRFPPLPKPAVIEILQRMGYDKSEAQRGAALAGGSVDRAVAALAGEEDSLRALVARWFFDSVAGRTPEQNWASRDNLDEGLETVKTLLRDWIAVAPSGGAKASQPLMRDYAGELAALGAPQPHAAAAVLAKIGDAQRMARTNVSPTMVAETVRLALTSAALTKSP
jgi:DNA polymerase-3 subunit delta'